MDDVLELIPVGAESNPITRDELSSRTGRSDRDVRQIISKLKAEYAVVNVGEGYYIADDPDDPNLEIYIRQEMHRIKEISKGLRRHKKLWKTNKYQETLKI